MKKIIFILSFILCINFVTAVNIDLNSSQIPINYTYNQTIERGHNATLTFLGNVSWMDFTDSIDIVVTNTSNSTYNIIYFDINDSFAVGSYSAKLTFNDSYTNETLIIEYNITISSVISSGDKFIQLDTVTYVYNLKTYEVDDPFTAVVPITITGNGESFITCTSWLKCEPLSFNLSNETTVYNINISTTDVDAGQYNHTATFWLQVPENTSQLYQTNISFIFNVEFEVEPASTLAESCNPINQTLVEYNTCVAEYFDTRERRLRELNESLAIIQYINDTEKEYVEVIPWSEDNGSFVINELLDLKEIDRILKSERVASKKLQAQLDELTRSNQNLTSSYNNMMGSLPNMIKNVVSSLDARIESTKLANERMSNQTKYWSWTKEIAKWLGSLALIVTIIVIWRNANAFWG